MSLFTAIIVMAYELGLKVITEAIETHLQHYLLTVSGGMWLWVFIL